MFWVECLFILVCLIFPWLSPVGRVSCFLHLFLIISVVLGVVCCMLKFCVFFLLEGGSGVLILCLQFVLLLFSIIEYVGCVIESVFCSFSILVDVSLLCVVFTFENLGLYLLCWLWASPVGRALFSIFVTSFFMFFVWFVFWFLDFDFFLLGLFIVMLGELIWLLFWVFIGLVSCVALFMFWFVFWVAFILGVFDVIGFLSLLLSLFFSSVTLCCFDFLFSLFSLRVFVFVSFDWFWCGCVCVVCFILVGALSNAFLFMFLFWWICLFSFSLLLFFVFVFVVVLSNTSSLLFGFFCVFE